MREDIIVGIDSRPAEGGGERVIRKLSDIRARANEAGKAIDGVATRGSRIAGIGVGADRAAGSMGRMAQSAGNASRQMQYLQRDIEETRKSAGGLGSGIEGLGGSLGKASGLLRVFGSLLGGLTFAAAVRGALAMTDELKRVEAQIRLTLSSTTSFNQAFADVQRIAAASRSDLSATAELYGRIARQAHALGISATEAATMTENYAKTLKISGASGLEAAASMRQFSQAIARGSLRGDEFISMLENNSRMTQLLADSLGVAQGGLIEMAQEGKITGDVIKKALIDPKFGEQLAKEFEQVPVSFEDAMTALKNSAMVALGEFDRGGQFSNWIISFVGDGTDGFEELGESARDFGTELRSTLAGLGSVFEPLWESGRSWFNFMFGETQSLKESIASLLGAWDDVANFLPSIGNAAKAFDNRVFGTNWQMETGSNARDTFLNSFDRTNMQLRARNGEQDLKNLLPPGQQWGNDPAAFRRWVETGNSIAPKPRPAATSTDDDKGTRTRTNQQVWNDFKNELAKRGIMMTPGGGHRTAEHQARIHAAGDSPLDGYNRRSRHQNWQAFDPLSRTHDDNKAREAAVAAGLKDFEIVTESRGRKHYEWKGAGKPGDMGDLLNDQEREAERLAKEMEQVAQKTQEFWDSLRNAGIEAKQLPLDAEQLSAEMKLQKAIQNDLVEGTEQITAADRERIQTLLEINRLNAVEGEVMRARLDLKNENIRLDRERQILATTTGEEQAKAMELERAMWPFRLSALEKGLDLEDQRVKLMMQLLEIEMAVTLEKDRQNRAIERGNQRVQDALDSADPRRRIQREYDKAIEEIGKSTAPQHEKDKAIKILTEQFGKDMNDIRRQFYEGILQDIEQVGDAIGGAFGDALKAVMKIGAQITQMMEATYKAGTAGAMSSDPIAQALSGLQGLVGKVQGGMAPGSKGFEALGKVGGVLGAASDGAAMGASIASIAPKKLGSTGASIGGAIGGAIGSAFGPIGSVVGSILGSVIGGLIEGGKKPPNGETNIVGEAGGRLKLGRSTGPSDMQSQNKSAAESVITGLYRIADALGGTVIAENISVGIGQRNEKWMVDEKGLGRTKGDGTPSFSSAAEAVAYAIKDAIKDGVIGGLSEASNRVLKEAVNPLDQLEAIAAYEGLDEAIWDITDPTKGAVEAFIQQMKRLDGQLRRAGYTTEELGKLQELYAVRRTELMKQLTEPYRTFIENITEGPDSGKSIAGQYQDAKSKFQGLQARIAAGERVDQDEFMRAGQAYFELSRQMFGSTTDNFAFDRDALVTGANGQIDNIEALTPEELLIDAIDTGNGEIVTGIDGTNDRLDTIIDIISGPEGNLNNGGSWGGGPVITGLDNFGGTNTPYQPLPGPSSPGLPV